MRSIRLATLACSALCALALTGRAAPSIPINQDESKVPPYTLPPLLQFRDGRSVGKSDWRERRAELLDLIAAEEYGRMPANGSATVKRTVVESSDNALDGLARRRQLRIDVSAGGKQASFTLLLYTPANAKGPVPCFLGLNFQGNHTVAADPALLIPTAWVPNNKEFGVQNNRASDQGRGKHDKRWEVEVVLRGGFGTAMAYCGELHPDRPDGATEGLGPLLAALSTTVPDVEKPACIATWAWGLQRALDALGQEPLVDASRVAVHGHSRLGKAALWAGATDERFALVISNNSGCGGAALHKRFFGETVLRINTSFPHWFAKKFRDYNGREDALPFDQHALLALIAPRPLYVASASEDLWADPHGEFLALKEADPVWILLGKGGLGGAAEPPVDTPVGEALGYHRRTGKHDITRYDWEQYISFATRWLKK